MKEFFDEPGKKIILALWILIVLSVFTAWLLYPHLFDLSNIGKLSVKYYYTALFIYFIIISLRGLILMPTTPALIAGILFFNPYQLFIVNIAGYLTSATIVYRYSGYLGTGEYFERKYPEEIKSIKKLFLKREIPIVALWSVLPFTHTDIIVYVTSSLNIRIKKCLAGVFIGESIINAFYIISITGILGLQ